MNTNSTKYTFIFAIIVCVVCGVLLSSIAEGFRTRQELNVELDVKKNILKAVRLKTPVSAKANPAEILKIYDSKIEEAVINAKGEIVPGKKPSDIKSEKDGLYPLYIYREDGKADAFAFPILGQGLWSALYGYLALEADVTTIRGITFYKHGETPGLGAEIEKDWFQDNFKGKTVWSLKEKKLTPTIVVKGKAEEIFKDEELKSRVDGITAATLTGNGVTDMMAKWLNIYEAYFHKLRKI